MRSRPVLLRFFALSWLVMLGVTSRNLLEARGTSGLAAAWLLAVWLTYGAIYLLPAIAAAWLARLLLGTRPWRAAGAARERFVLGAALVVTTATLSVLHVDAIVHRIFGFHLNGFVWNLMTTPGGLASMDAGGTSWAGLARTIALLLGLESACLVAALKLGRPWEALRPARPGRAVGWALAAFVALSGLERLAFAISDFAGYKPILRAFGVMPFYLRTRAPGLARRLGFEPLSNRGLEVTTEGRSLDYPKAPLALAPDRKRWNVVWLVAESLRADALDPEVMPATDAFARRALSFRRHYSGGNGTRTGVFSMFYGVHAALWFPFLAARRGPVVMDHFVDDGYATLVQTSAKFTSPEFDLTVFARVPPEDRFEGDDSRPGWQRDRELVGRMVDWIERRDPKRPFFTFMFFESPHAQYHFPDDSTIRRPYLEGEEFDYTALDPARDAPLLKNRYLNAVHHLDSQFARIFEALERGGLLDSTIVVVTGDHGEEFMEKGRWGHHSDFSEEQIRVPLVLSIPGAAPRVVDVPTSHVDLPPTILARLGVTNPPADYCLGLDLLGEARHDAVVIADWDHLCVRDPAWKGIFPVNQPGFTGCVVTTADDAPVEDEARYMREHKDLLADVLRGLSRFAR